MAEGPHHSEAYNKKRDQFESVHKQRDVAPSTTKLTLRKAAMHASEVCGAQSVGAFPLAAKAEIAPHRHGIGSDMAYCCSRSLLLPNWSIG